MDITIGIISGYANPINAGHIKMIKEAKRKCDLLTFIVNNDKQQMLKKGKIITNEIDRLEVVYNLKHIDYVDLSIDEDETVKESIKNVHKYFYKMYGKNAKFIFMNGGDRQSEKDIPETNICKRLEINMLFGIGDVIKNEVTDNE